MMKTYYALYHTTTKKYIFYDPQIGWGFCKEGDISVLPTMETWMLKEDDVIYLKEDNVMIPVNELEFHGIEMEGQKLSLFVLHSEYFKCLCFGCCCKCVEAEILLLTSCLH